jgi:hypothetical protein
MGSTLELDGSPVLWPRRFGDGILARVFGASLDTLLAVGCSPETSRLLTARARQLVSLPERISVAHSWEHLLRVAQHTPERRVTGSFAAAAAVPVRADRIISAEPAIRELVDRLTAPLPVPARGVAMARLLLSDATGPVYSRRSRADLTAAVEAATAQLDPALPLLPSP